jgi:hypothetical protein
MDTEHETVEEEVVSPIEQAMESQEEAPQEEVVEQKEEEKVPLSALQKERRKRQEAERRNKLYEDLQEKQLREQPQASPQEEEDLYEAATKSDLSKAEKQIMRAVDERSWIKNNPERAQEVNEKLQEFLKQRPNLASAIEAAQNRYEEAWTLMNALSPKQKALLKAPPAPKREAPGAPSAVPKAAAMNQAVDFMSMSDSEYNAWRQTQRKRR